MISIQQKTIRAFPTTQIADKAIIDPINVNPGVSASAIVVLGAMDGQNFVEMYRQNVEMTAEQYKAWGTDDDYAVNCLLANIGLVRV